MACVHDSETRRAATGLLALVADDVTRETVRQVAARLGWPGATVRDGGIVAARAWLERPAVAAPAVLLIDVSDCADVLGAMDGLAEVCEAQTRVIAIGTLNDVALYRGLMQLGVSDYLVKPFSADNLAEALQRAGEQERPPAPARRSRSLALIGARGGVGTTSLAAAIAWELAEARRRHTVLLDLDLQFGAAALSLDLEPGRGLRELLAHPERIDSLLIGSAASQAGERLRVLGAEEPLDRRMDLAPHGLETLLQALAETAEQVVIDVPRHLDACGRAALAQADVVGLVTDLSLTGLRDAQRLSTLLSSLRPQGEILLIANRLGGVAGEAPKSEFERALGREFDAAVPFDLKAANTAAEQGRTLLSGGKSGPAAAELRRLVDRLAGAPAAPAGGGGWMERLLGGSRHVRS